MTEPGQQADQQPGVIIPGQYAPGQPVPEQYAPAQPGVIPAQYVPGQPAPFGVPGFPGFPGAVAVAPPRKKRRVFLILAFVLAGVLVLCAGVGTTAYFATRDTGAGTPDPGSAVVGFLKSVYTEEDLTGAEKYICPQSRDDDTVNKKIKEVKSLREKYDVPVFTWSTPDVSAKTTTEATVKVTVTMKTRDEKVASQALTFTTVNSHGWWVCEVSSAK